ncbi:hypothetical protein BUALT_Bualt15G0124200 [Buddleja alternifolia]|uniref:Ubiquitin-like protease family profile domain-containing protein n=1 Tax=Buddleja alternifolia TaxID=168488 RepID=A0AAV6WEY9_9LAMI|nr:hypothetical protein BUALT_Bualt15G0124200 [Buddleja alternifolia]
MAETERAKSSSKPLDVFEFKEEEEEDVQTEIALKNITAKFGYTHAMDHKDTSLDHVPATEIQSKENDSGICGGVATDIDYNHDVAGSFTPIAPEDFDEEKMPKLNNFLHNDYKSHEQAAEMKSDILESGSVFASVGCGWSTGATVWLEDHSNCVFPESSCNDESVRVALDADGGMTSSDGPSSDHCFSNWSLGDGMTGIVFYPDYIDYCGTFYLDPVVSFSRSSLEAKSKIIENERTFHIHLDIDDIVRIESKWSARYEVGTVNIYFISKAVTQDDVAHNASGIHELRFPTLDSNWYQKQEAIQSLDLRYKALWSVLLDTGMEKCSALPEGKAMVLPRSYFPNFNMPFEEVIYPRGDPDAVSVSKRDVDLLLPDTFVNDTIIDFYIKYLKTKQNMDCTKFHFFNSFFFRKLADMDRDPSSAFDGKAAFHRVRKWTRKVNLLEKDFIFIPVNYNLHWSLIIICYFGEVAGYKGKLISTNVEDENLVRVPCILHMDSLRGNHEGLKDLIQSYLWEEWKERQKEACEDMYSKFRNLKFVTLELPQQQNSSDCGLFLLHYVELFLEEVPANFNIYKITSSLKFLQADWFPPGEASMKRAHIERLICGLLDTTHSQDCPPSASNGTRDYEIQSKENDYESQQDVHQLQASPECSANCDKLDVSVCDLMVNFNDHQHTLATEDSPLPSDFQVDHGSLSESSDEQHSAKRMRIDGGEEGLTSNLSNHLHL